MKEFDHEKKNRRVVFLLSAVFCAVLSCGVSYADSEDKKVLDERIRYLEAPKEGEAFGVLQEKRVRISFKADETYNDNIYLTKDNSISDYITTLTPQASLYCGSSNNLFYAAYNADAMMYGKKNKENRINQDIEGRAELFRNSKAKLIISDTFRPTTDPATSETNEFVRRLNNAFDAKLKYDVSDKTALEIDYNQLLQNYLSAGFRDLSYIQHVISPVLYWHLSPKLSATGEYNMGVTSYYEGTNYNSLYYQARGGIQGKLSPKSVIYLKGGYQYRNYESTARKNTQSADFEGVYDYFLSDKTTVHLLGSYGINESVYEDVGYFKSANLYASVAHDLMNSLAFNSSVFYILSYYPKETESSTGELKKRLDNLYGFSANLVYHLRNWISVYAGYEFRIKDSNMRDFEYRNSRVSCGTTISF